MRGEQQHTFAFGGGAAQMVFAIEGEGKMFCIPGKNGDAINQRASERVEMFEHQPALFPPRQLAKDSPVKIHRGRHVWRDERKINCGRHQQHVGKAKSEYAQNSEEELNAPAAPAKFAGAGPVFGFWNWCGHVRCKPRR